jgi:light-regulated signal transduction histidine kinase (bacteriophytochrome)
MAAVDMRGLAQTCLHDMAADYPAAQVDIDSLPPATGDAAALRQVFANLIGNALKYSSRKDTPRIEIGAREREGEAVYFVRDNGAGFNMEYAQRLFGVFQRVHTDAEFPGTGVGLAIVKNIVERHGGRVWAEAAKDEGATFYFSLGGR